jgi:hypothetical protein
MWSPRDIDLRLLSLCNALNRCEGVAVVKTVAGRGSEPARVWLRLKELSALHNISRALCDRFYDPVRWRLAVDHVDVFPFTVFYLEGDLHQANQLARNIEHVLLVRNRPWRVRG